ncbi:metallophosphoesterase [Marinicella litoralis]|uniref:Icc-related predicted phosphoesterase n=1 Tax=Marinicella litoralis TaxID=644220 RepID=A0A4R6XIW5_9GAMM|nr:metallophosphoesterase [Marinicella litoralis]TDR18269.1 Icc-related predicted phosphoesterase [Marinicella litoralis]
MKILVLSDLHIEFEGYQVDYKDVDVVVLAGDVHVKDNGFKWASDKIKEIPVIYVLGNHEFYGAAYPKLVDKLKEDCKGSNIHVLENDSININGINFLGCTLWTDFNLFGASRIDGYQCQQVMTDYKKIRLSPKFSKVRSIDIFSIHRKSLNWLTNKLDELEGQKNIVVTHHAPSLRSVPDHYKDNVISSAYASNLENVIENYNPRVWIHGHLHNSSNYHIGETNVVCNPKGYSDERNPEFDNNFIIEIT